MRDRVSVAVPGRKLPPGVRMLPLPGFPGLNLGVVWHGPRTAVTDAMVAALKKQVDLLEMPSPGE